MFVYAAMKVFTQTNLSSVVWTSFPIFNLYLDDRKLTLVKEEIQTKYVLMHLNEYHLGAMSL